MLSQPTSAEDAMSSKSNSQRTLLAFVRSASASMTMNGYFSRCSSAAQRTRARDARVLLAQRKPMTSRRWMSPFSSAAHSSSKKSNRSARPHQGLHIEVGTGVAVDRHPVMAALRGRPGDEAADADAPAELPGFAEGVDGHENTVRTYGREVKAAVS
jgi:hypothetical protein